MMAAQRHAARPSLWRPHGASSCRVDGGPVAGRIAARWRADQTAGRDRHRGPDQRADQLLFRIVVICVSAALAAASTVCLPVTMFCSISCRTFALSTSGHVPASGVNQLLPAAVAVAALPGCAAACESSALAFGSAPL